MGRLVRDPSISYSQNGNQTCIARYTLAVDRRYKREGEQTADFISCVAFGKAAEFAGKYFHQGLKIAITGHIQTGSYVNRDGQKVYTTDVFVEEQEFAESKKASDSSGGNSAPAANTPKPEETDFMSIPDGLEDEDLPFA